MMRQKIQGWIILLALIVALVPLSVQAQGDSQAWTAYELNLRTGPGGSYSVISILPPNTGLLLEGRDAAAAWVLARTLDGAQRGWLASSYLTYRADVSVAALPVSSEIVGTQPAANPGESPADPNAPPPNGSIESKELIYDSGQSEYYRLVYWSDGLRVVGFLGTPKGGGPFPAVILNRGGAWNSGALTGREIIPYVEAGYVAAASQYRGNMGSEGSEAFGSGDVADALNLLPVLYQLPQVDPGNIGMVGHSRGGLVTYMALKAEVLSGQNRIKAAVTMGGISDLAAWVAERPDIADDTFVALVGGLPSYAQNLYDERSAVRWPDLLNVPLLILHGEADAEVSVTQSQRLADALRAAGKPVELITYPGDDHMLSGQLGGAPDALRFLGRMLTTPGGDRSFDGHWDAIRTVNQWFWEHYN